MESSFFFSKGFLGSKLYWMDVLLPVFVGKVAFLGGEELEMCSSLRLAWSVLVF